MDAVWKIIDRLTAQIPERFMKFVRFGALFVWVILAAIVTFYTYGQGKQNVPAQGQDLSLANIMERVTMEENRKKKPNIVIPDTRELLPEVSGFESPAPEPSPRAALLPEDNQAIESSQLPPFAGEPGVHIFPGQRAPEPTLRPVPDGVELLPLKEKVVQDKPPVAPRRDPLHDKKVDLLPVD